jgi:RNA polymerase sigma factor (sigma-70 family)
MIYPVAMEYLSLEERGAGQSDEEILSSSLTHPSLFALLVRKYEDPFLRKALSIIHEREEAEDIVQEAFTKIYLAAPKFKKQEGASFSSWGYRILINTALTHYAKRKRIGKSTVALDDEIWQLIPDRSLRQFEKKELNDLVASVLTRMPESFARALHAFFIEEKSQEEIAREEGLSVGAIKTRVHRAKAEFRKVYKSITNNI